MAKKAKKKAPKKNTFSTKEETRQAIQRAVKKTARSQNLPGMEQVRNARLDSFCESIGDEREAMNKARLEEKGLKQAAVDEMTRKGVTVYRHATIELALIPGAAKLRIRVTKEEGDATVEGGEPVDTAEVDTTFGDLEG